MKHLTDQNFEHETAHGTILVDFHATWCGPCRMLAPILDQLAKDLAGEVTIGKVDIDAEAATASKFRISSVPTVILFRGGKEVGRLTGLRNLDQMKQFIASAKH